MSDLHTQIADILADYGLHGVVTRELAANAILDKIAEAEG